MKSMSLKHEHVKKKENTKKRKNFKLPQKDDEIFLDDEPPMVRKKTSHVSNEVISSKQLRNEKKKAISELNELRNILGTEERDAEEKQLEELIFGCDPDELEDSQSEEEKGDKNVKQILTPAWEDDDDENISVEEKASQLKKCHRSVYLRGSEKYSEFVQEKFKKVVGEPKWAELGKEENSEDDSGDELLQKTGNFIEPSKSLPKSVIQMQKCPSLVDENSKNSHVKSVEFHPVARVAIAAGTCGTANLFQIDGKINAKIQSVHFENFPIHAAHFTRDGSEILVGSNKFGHFFSYDMISGKVSRIPWDKGMEQQNIRRFHMSPDGKYIVIQGRYGYIHLVTAKSKEWVGSLKMNGEVISVTFNKDGSRMYSHGETGEIYVWDMSSRKCIHKFTDEGCMAGTSITLSPNDQYLVTGSDCGVVNIYDNNSVFDSNSPKPLKVLMNLTTEVTQMKFNCTSELLAINSSHKPNAVKLVHFPSMSVYSNFPMKEDQSGLKFVNSLDISVNSGYLCLGNNLSTVHIFRLKHYHNY